MLIGCTLPPAGGLPSPGGSRGGCCGLFSSAIRNQSLVVSCPPGTSGSRQRTAIAKHTLGTHPQSYSLPIREHVSHCFFRMLAVPEPLRIIARGAPLSSVFLDRQAVTNQILSVIR